MSGFGFALAIILSVVGFVSPPFLMQFLSLWLSMPSLLQVLPYTEQCCLVFCMQETITKLSTSSNISNGSSLTPQTASKKALLDFKIAWVHLCLLSSLQLIEVHYLLFTLPYLPFPYFISLDHGFPPIFKKSFSTDTNKVTLICTIFFPALPQIFSSGFTFLKPWYFHSNTYCCEAPSGIQL